MTIICVSAHPRTCSEEFKTVLCAYTHFISCIQCFHNKFLLADENDILIILIVILYNANILTIGYYSDVQVCISFSLISLKSKNSSSFAHSSLSLYVRIRDSRQGSGSFMQYFHMIIIMIIHRIGKEKICHNSARHIDNRVTCHLHMFLMMMLFSLNLSQDHCICVCVHLGPHA